MPLDKVLFLDNLSVKFQDLSLKDFFSSPGKFFQNSFITSKITPWLGMKCSVVFKHNFPNTDN